METKTSDGAGKRNGKEVGGVDQLAMPTVYKQALWRVFFIRCWKPTTELLFFEILDDCRHSKRIIQEFI